MSFRHYRQLNSVAINQCQFKQIQFPYHTGYQSESMPAEGIGRDSGRARVGSQVETRRFGEAGKIITQAGRETGEVD
jgi:hypothetical protein